MAQRNFKVTATGLRLDKFLAAQNPGISRANLQRLIKAGKVAVEGKPVLKQDHRLTLGASVAFSYESPRIRPQPEIPLSVAYEDKNVMIVDKPAGLIMHPTPTKIRDSLAAALLAHAPQLAGIGDAFRPGIVHRLDADTSGLVVIAKNQKAHTYLKQEFHDRRVIKRYIALVHGKIVPKHGTFELPIGRKTGEGRFRAGFGREAKTEYWVEKYFTRRSGAGKRAASLDFYSLVRIQLHTGRTHQIRVHFAHNRHPIVSDSLYGRALSGFDQKFCPRQFLHAQYLKFRLPSGTIKEFESRLPQDLLGALTCLQEIKQY